MLHFAHIFDMNEFSKNRWWFLLFFSVYACSLTGNLLLNADSARSSIIEALVMGVGVTLALFFLDLWRHRKRNGGEPDSE